MFFGRRTRRWVVLGGFWGGSRWLGGCGPPESTCLSDMQKQED